MFQHSVWNDSAFYLNEKYQYNCFFLLVLILSKSLIVPFQFESFGVEILLIFSIEIELGGTL